MPSSVDTYGIALRLAREALRRRDPAVVAERCRVEWRAAAEAAGSGPPRGEYRVRYLGIDFVVSLPEGTVCSSVPPDAPAAQRAASAWDAIPILHYLASTAPPPPRGEPIAFADLADGRFYDSPFRNRCCVPLARAFGDAPARLLEVADQVDAVPWIRGDASLAIRALPRVDVYVVVYRGDDEFPAGSSVLFSSDVAAFLPTEDIVVVGGSAVARLVRAARARTGPA